MQITDSIADMITRIRNAGSARHEFVDIPASNTKKAIAEILFNEGFIKKYEIIDDNKQGIIRITLKYTKDKKSVISGIKRISKPGLRVYAGKDDIPKVLGGLGIAIISTSKGIVTDKVARENNVGGENNGYYTGHIHFNRKVCTLSSVHFSSYDSLGILDRNPTFRFLDIDNGSNHGYKHSKDEYDSDNTKNTGTKLFAHV
jgi:small subunit ribosomal protein S8